MIYFEEEGKDQNWAHWQIAVVLIGPWSIRCFALFPTSPGVLRSVYGFVRKLG